MWRKWSRASDSCGRRSPATVSQAAHAAAARPSFAPRMTNSTARPSPPTTRISRSLSAAWRRSSAVTMQQDNKGSDTTLFTLFGRFCCIYFILLAAVNSRLDMFSLDQGYLLLWLFLSPMMRFSLLLLVHTGNNGGDSPPLFEPL